MKWKKADTALVKNSLKMKSAFFDCFYIMPPLKKGCITLLPGNRRP